MFGSLPAPKNPPNNKRVDGPNATESSDSKRPRVAGLEPNHASADPAAAAAAPAAPPPAGPAAYRVTAAAYSEDKGSRQTFEDVATIRLEDP